MQVTRNNHFVPQSYLKRWADKDSLLWNYQLLVSHDAVKPWKQSPVRGLACKKDLYTSMQDEEENDEFEKRIKDEFEDPALKAFDRVISGKELTVTDWERLALFALAQDLRTPQSYYKWKIKKERWEPESPDRFKRICDKVILRRKEHRESGQPFPESATNPDAIPFPSTVKVKIDKLVNSDKPKMGVGMSYLPARKEWLHDIYNTLTGWVSEKVITHSWSIFEPADGFEWFTSDNPVVLMNYYGDRYDLEGGWGVCDGNILMPLSPRHLLFTQIGSKFSPRLKLDSNKTHSICTAIAQNAHRIIFASKPTPYIEELRTRVVDQKAFDDEKKARIDWHSEQTAAQNQYDSSE